LLDQGKKFERMRERGREADSKEEPQKKNEKIEGQSIH